MTCGSKLQSSPEEDIPVRSESQVTGIMQTAGCAGKAGPCAKPHRARGVLSHAHPCSGWDIMNSALFLLVFIFHMPFGRSFTVWGVWFAASGASVPAN